MPYYSLRLKGGDRSEHLEVKHLFDGRNADFTGTTGFFYVERSYDIATMKRNASSAGRGIKVSVREISDREYHWRQHR